MSDAENYTMAGSPINETPYFVTHLRSLEFGIHKQFGYPMKQQVIQAIKERRLLHLRYEGRKQLMVAPQALGETMTGYVALFCCAAGQAQEGETHWRLLELGRITSVQVLPRHFGPLPSHRGLPGREFRRLEAVV